MAKRHNKGLKQATRPVGQRASCYTAVVEFLMGGAAIAAVSLVVYLPAINGGFLTDDQMLIMNQLLGAPNALAHIWTLDVGFADPWPMTNSLFWLERQAWGASTTGFHVVSLILHVTGTLLFWRTLAKLEVPGAFWAAILFAVHPLNVESVAWIAQQKNMLALQFFLLTIYCWARFESREVRDAAWACRTWYALSLASFILAMLSKGSTLTLPLILLGFILWNRAPTKADAFRLAPFFALALAGVLVNLWYQRHGQNVVIREVSILQRFLGAGNAIVFYLGKCLWPADLWHVYPDVSVNPGQPKDWLGLGGVIAATGLLVFWARRPWGRAMLFAWAFFCVALLPVLGLTDVGYMKYSLVADHYAQLALLAFAALTGAALALINRAFAPWGVLLMAGLALGLGWKARQQDALYDNPVVFYSLMLDANPNSVLLNNNLAKAYIDSGQPKEAFPYAEKALSLAPQDFQCRRNVVASHTNYGQQLAARQEYAAAIAQYDEALKHDDGFLETHFNRGNSLRNLGRWEESRAAYDEAARLALSRGDVETLNKIQSARALLPPLVAPGPEGAAP